MKKIFALIVALLIVTAYFNMPDVISSAIPSAYYVTPNILTYENVVNCTGTVQSAEIREIYLQSSLVPSQICIQVGDEVSEGDLLARVDVSATEKLNTSPQNLLLGLTDSVAASNSTEGINWLALASDLGLTAVLNGGDIDYARLQNTIESGGTSSIKPNSGAAAANPTPDKITSPIKGTVIDVNLRVNSPASAGKAVFTIADTENFIVLAAVNEGDIAQINIGDTATVRGVGFGGKVYNGTVSKVYPTARKSLTGAETVVDIEIILNNADKSLKHGFSAKVEIMGDNDYELITVPYEAIRQDENNKEYVYVYENGKLKRQVVVTGQELTNDVEILGGLAANSVVIYNPSEVIKEGSMINIKGRANS